MKLIIFDLDQTLVDVFPFHNKATEQTFKKIFKIKARMDEIEYVGKTIKKVLIELAALKGIPKSKRIKKISKALRSYDAIFIRNLPKNVKRFVLPGVYSFINKLLKDKNNFLIVLTGDSEKIAKAVLKRSNLLEKFHFLITGEHAISRIKLMKKALKKAHKTTKKAKFEKIIIIGDSIHDIEAGKAVRALTIAVLTGKHTKAQLKKAGASYIFKNLADKKILQTINK